VIPLKEGTNQDEFLTNKKKMEITKFSYHLISRSVFFLEGREGGFEMFMRSSLN